MNKQRCSLCILSVFSVCFSLQITACMSYDDEHKDWQESYHPYIFTKEDLYEEPHISSTQVHCSDFIPYAYIKRSPSNTSKTNISIFAFERATFVGIYMLYKNGTQGAFLSTLYPSVMHKTPAETIEHFIGKKSKYQINRDEIAKTVAIILRPSESVFKYFKTDPIVFRPKYGDDSCIESAKKTLLASFKNISITVEQYQSETCPFVVDMGKHAHEYYYRNRLPNKKSPGVRIEGKVGVSYDQTFIPKEVELVLAAGPEDSYVQTMASGHQHRAFLTLRNQNNG